MKHENCPGLEKRQDYPNKKEEQGYKAGKRTSLLIDDKIVYK